MPYCLAIYVYFLFLLIIKFVNNSLIVQNYTIPKDDVENSCLKMQASFLFNVRYQAREFNQTKNQTVNFRLDNLQYTYTGSCLLNKNIIEFEFLDDWRLELYFENISNIYSFNHVVLYYQFTGDLFPNAIHFGAHSEIFDYSFFNSSIGTSFTCNSGIFIDLDDVKINMTQIQVQPFFYKPPYFPYDQEIKCSADIPDNPDKNKGSIVLPTVIGACVLLLFFVVIAIYMIIKCKAPRIN